MLNPETPLFREGRYLLAEEPDLRDGALYHSVLAAIAEGNATRGGIASYIGRKSADIAHPIDVLGGLPAKVGAGARNDPAGRSAHEVDVVVTGIPGGQTPLLAIGQGAGFTSELRTAAARAPDVLLVSAAELYGLNSG